MQKNCGRNKTQNSSKILLLTVSPVQYDLKGITKELIKEING